MSLRLNPSRKSLVQSSSKPRLTTSSPESPSGQMTAQREATGVGSPAQTTARLAYRVAQSGQPVTEANLRAEAMKLGVREDQVNLSPEAVSAGQESAKYGLTEAEALQDQISRQQLVASIQRQNAEAQARATQQAQLLAQQRRQQELQAIKEGANFQTASGEFQKITYPGLIPKKTEPGSASVYIPLKSGLSSTPESQTNKRTNNNAPQATNIDTAREKQYGNEPQDVGFFQGVKYKTVNLLKGVGDDLSQGRDYLINVASRGVERSEQLSQYIQNRIDKGLPQDTRAQRALAGAVEATAGVITGTETLAFKGIRTGLRYTIPSEQQNIDKQLRQKIINAPEKAISYVGESLSSAKGIGALGVTTFLVAEGLANSKVTGSTTAELKTAPKSPEAPPKIERTVTPEQVAKEQKRQVKLNERVDKVLEKSVIESVTPDARVEIIPISEKTSLVKGKGETISRVVTPEGKPVKVKTGVFKSQELPTVKQEFEFKAKATQEEVFFPDVKGGKTIRLTQQRKLTPAEKALGLQQKAIETEANILRNIPYPEVKNPSTGKPIKLVKEQTRDLTIDLVPKDIVKAEGLVKVGKQKLRTQSVIETGVDNPRAKTKAFRFEDPTDTAIAEFTSRSKKTGSKDITIKEDFATGAKFERPVELEEYSFEARGKVGKGLKVKPIKAPQPLTPKEIVGETFYHGSAKKLREFDFTKLGSNKGTNRTGQGLYVTRNKEYAKVYAEQAGGKKGIVNELQLKEGQKIKYETRLLSEAEKRLASVQAKAEGYAGIYFEKSLSRVKGKEASQGLIFNPNEALEFNPKKAKAPKPEPYTQQEFISPDSDLVREFTRFRYEPKRFVAVKQRGYFDIEKPFTGKIPEIVEKKQPTKKPFNIQRNLYQNLPKARSEETRSVGRGLEQLNPSQQRKNITDKELANIASGQQATAKALSEQQAKALIKEQFLQSQKKVISPSQTDFIKRSLGRQAKIAKDKINFRVRKGLYELENKTLPKTREVLETGIKTSPLQSGSRIKSNKKQGITPIAKQRDNQLFNPRYDLEQIRKPIPVPTQDILTAQTQKQRFKEDLISKQITDIGGGVPPGFITPDFPPPTDIGGFPFPNLNLDLPGVGASRGRGREFKKGVAPSLRALELNLKGKGKAPKYFTGIGAREIYDPVLARRNKAYQKQVGGFLK